MMETAIDFGAGCLGGVSGLLVGHPFDTVKVRLQLQTTGSHYRGTLHCFKAIIKSEGMRGLYKGVTSPLYSVAFINAIIFGVQGDIQRRLSNPTSIASYAASGGAAGLVQCLVCSPMELAKIRMQMQGAAGMQDVRHTSRSVVAYRSSLDCLAQIYSTEGVRGVYRGLGFTILREVPSFMIYFASYEYLCRQWARRLGLASGEPVPTWALFVSGGLAGCLSWMFLNPIDVVKSRIQMDSAVTREYSGYMDCFRKSVSREGYGVLTKGLVSTILRAFPTNAATLTTVTWVLRLLNPKETEQQRMATIERSGVIAHME